jgi:hypothetical protein
MAKTWRVTGPEGAVLGAFERKEDAEVELEHLVEVHGYERKELAVTDEDPAGKQEG